MTQIICKFDYDGYGSTLVSLLEKAGNIFIGLGAEFSPDIQKLDVLKNRLLEGRFHLAVLGQFKRGKSTLLNALMGEPLLPVSVVPLTAVPTFIQFEANPLIRITCGIPPQIEEFKGQSVKERMAFLSKYVAENENPKNTRNVTDIQVFASSSILSRGVVLIDTPGIGSTYSHNTQATMDFLDQCDAALFMISADPPITEVELEFLGKIRKKVPRLFFVLNKIDYLNEDELGQALSFFRETLAEHSGVDTKTPIFCISARKGLEAKIENNVEKWASSGLAELEKHLVEFLVKNKFAALAESVSCRAEDIIESVLMGARISSQALQLPQKELEEKIAVFEESLEQAEIDRLLIQDILEGDKKRMAAFIERQAQALREESRIFLNDIKSRELSKTIGKSSKSQIQGAWAESIPEYFEHKRADLAENVKKRLLEALAGHENRIASLIETLRKTASDLFQVQYIPLRAEEALETSKKPYWVLNTWKTETLPVLKSIDQRLEDLVNRNVENLRWAVIQNVDMSFLRFAARLRERLNETVSVTKGVMETANLKRKEHGENIAEEIAGLNKSISDLEKLKEEISRRGE